jgi:UDP-4-amino-4,6-dideoxy-N-acetyl-beta-L-altrosamine transaminase
MKPIPYGRQEITEEDIQTVVESLRSDFLTQGPRVEEFEKAFAQVVGASQAIAVTNGTAALHLSVLALGLNPGQKVLAPAISFVASSNCVLYAGGEVEFVDIDPVTYCLDLDLLENKLASNPFGTYAGVVSVDFAGLPVDLERLRQIANKYGLWILEDACHAPGAQFQKTNGEWSQCGSGEFADLAIFSFHPVKHIATAEGGMVTTRQLALAEKLRTLRTHGIVKTRDKLNHYDGPWYMEMQMLGFNYRIPDLLCALGTSQLKRFSENIKRRRQIAARYMAELKDLDLQLPQVNSKQMHGYHLFVIQEERRADLYSFLNQRNIFPQVHYLPIPDHPYYIKRYGKQSFPTAQNYYQKALSLPMYHSLLDDEQSHVIRSIQDFYGS